MNFEDFYKEQLAKSGNGYDDQINGYKASQAAEEQALEARRAASAKKLEDQKFQAQQDAYVARRMAEKNMPQLLAAQGISGGMTETTAGNIYADYLNSQNKANSAFTSANAELGTNYNTNLASLKTKWSQAIGEAQQNKRNDAFAKAQWAYQAYQAEEERKRQEAEKAAAAAASSRSYSSGGGGTPTTPSATKPTGYWYNGTNYATRAGALAAQNLDLNNKKKYSGGFVGGGFGNGTANRR